MDTLFVLACLVLVTAAQPIIFKNCPDSASQVVEVDISPCTVQPCVFKYNTTATVKVTFKAPEDSSTLKAEIFGIIAGIKIGWPMPNPDGCKDSNISCPVTAGQQYTYSSTLDVPKDAPKLRLVVQWSLTGSKGEKQFCFDFPMEIA